MNYYRRYLGDYMRDTMHLSMLEHGAYTLLLDAYYASEKPLPADYDALYRVCRAMSRSEQDAVRSVADRYFPVADDGLRHNGRADREVGVAQTTIEKQRKSGVEAAAKRWGKSESTDKSVDGSTHDSTDGSAIQPPTTNHHIPTTNHQPPSEKALSGKPDGMRQQAREVLDFLNAKARRSFRHVDVNIDFIVARFREGATVQDMKAVIAKKCREWPVGHDMNKYLRPETLFNRTKFNQYVGELVEAPHE